MTIARLPLAPRPLPGEAPSSWVRRIAARYDLEPNDLVRYLLGSGFPALGRVQRLDTRADPELEGALAEAASIDITRIVRQRVVSNDGTAWSWHRTRPAWCPRCVHDDLRRRGETYERASWRLGCCVFCPEHGLLLEDTCRRCLAEAGCHFRGADGRVKLECDRCTKSVCWTSIPKAGEVASGEGAFGIRITPEMTTMVLRLQADLKAAFRDRSPHGNHWLVRTAAGLVTVVRDLTESLIWFTGVRVDLPIEWQPIASDRDDIRLVRGPITPAVLRVYGAHGALAMVAAMLQGVSSGRGLKEHRWRLNHDIRIISLETFVACLPVSERQWLWTRAAQWESSLRDTLSKACTAVQAAAQAPRDLNARRRG